MNMVREGQKRKTVAHLCHLEKREWRDRVNILEKDKPEAVVMGKVRDIKESMFTARQLITDWMRMIMMGREPLILGGLKSLAETMDFPEGTIRLFVEAMDVVFLEGAIRFFVEAMDLGFLEGTIRLVMEAMDMGFLEGFPEGMIRAFVEATDMILLEDTIRAFVEATDAGLLEGTAFGEAVNQDYLED
ncbi:unnamed protein product [Effrenium voratum]|nr:unnamed protein product [Effrenium voratum]